jgi:hypothetical protein
VKNSRKNRNLKLRKFENLERSENCEGDSQLFLEIKKTSVFDNFFEENIERKNWYIFLSTKEKVRFNLAVFGIRKTRKVEKSYHV